MGILPLTTMQPGEEVLYPFAYEECLCQLVGDGRLSGPLLHIWRHPRAFVLGLRDRRLPRAREAMDWLRQQGFSVMVRHSGGAAVPLDLGVVNLTLIQASDGRHVSMHDDFRRMVSWLQTSLQPWGVALTAGEVAGSYCPGEFDLSVNGRKCCGLAQRRQQRSVAVQAFVNAEGDAQERAEWAREFYARAGGDGRAAQASGAQEGAAASALVVEAGVMASLSECYPGGFPGAEAWIETLFAAHPKIAAPPIPRAAVDEMVATLRTRYNP